MKRIPGLKRFSSPPPRSRIKRPEQTEKNRSGGAEYIKGDLKKKRGEKRTRGGWEKKGTALGGVRMSERD